MIQAISLIDAGTPPGLLASQHRLRHRIFVERLGWELPSYQGLEYDEYDTPAATYLVWREESGEARGVARLIPTTQPYMLQRLWPGLCGGYLPMRPEVWEGSRFGVDHAVSPALRERIGRELIIACLEFGLAHAVREFIVLMPSFFIRRQIGGAGCEYRLLGQTRQFGRVQMAVAAVQVNAAALAEARRRAGISSRVLDIPVCQETAA